MAEKRMFAKSIIDTDIFLSMSASTQNLYFHLTMRADDDGFIGSPRTIMRMIGATDDDMKVLIAKRYVLIFESGVIVIKHWRIHNTLQKDRYKPTTYTEELSTLGLDDKKAYVEKEKLEQKNAMFPNCIQNVSKMDTQISIDKYRLDKNSINNIYIGDEKNDLVNIIPSVDDINVYYKAYCEEHNLTYDELLPQTLYDYYNQQDWKVKSGSKYQPIKDWRACVRTWCSKRKQEENKKTIIINKNKNIKEMPKWLKEQLENGIDPLKGEKKESANVEDKNITDFFNETK